MSETTLFPDGFLWGAATSACQIEGSPLADGAGPSIWHRFAHLPGRIRNGDTPDVACDHYRRWREDVALMRELGLRGYRFSVAWERVLPEGRGRVNPAGLAFYQRLVDALLEAGIQPMVTLYHWDLPAALDDAGGWGSREIVPWFADYAQVMFDALGDRVPLWATLNEPWVVMDGGYLHGAHAPGHHDVAEAARVTHHLLLAHGAAVERFRAVPRAGQVGVVVNLEPKDPASQASEDLAATVRADAYMNRQYLDPLLLGRYPDEMGDLFGAAWPAWPDADLARIRQPLDFLGVNYYHRGVMRHAGGPLPPRAERVRVPGSVYTPMDWEVHPPSFTRTLRWVRERYGALPLYVTENGAAFTDPPTAPEGRVADPARVRFLRDHLRAARAALAAGVDLRGYFVWSLLDNFEWAEGYARRFGICHVDFASQVRTPKDSAHWYAEVIRTNGASLDRPLAGD